MGTSGTAPVRHRGRGIVAALAAVALLVTGAVAVTERPAYATDYPSWNDVLEARRDVARAQQKITEIRAAIEAITAEVARTEAIAQEKGALYYEAQLAFDEAAYTADQLQAQADAAQARADESRLRAGQFVAELARSGGGDLSASLFTNPGQADELLSLVGLDPGQYGGRYPHQLSGGQRQRGGGARALAADPPVLLMDEPFGAVDPIVRGRLQDEFLKLQRSLGKTVMLVTHDIDEAVRLGDKVAVFQPGGRLAQYDEPTRLLGAPADDFVAEFVGAARGLRRLAVTPIAAAELEPVEGRSPRETVPVSGSLEDALAVLMRTDDGVVGVERDGRLVGVLTPASVHAALRRSVAEDVQRQPPTADAS